jgi:hypothetical protein
MKPEPAGARDANRMMIGEAALACGAETAPGKRKALTARSAIEACFIRFLVGSRGDAG